VSVSSSTWRRASKFYWFTSAFGVGKLIPKISLSRYVEYPLVYEYLALQDGHSILDVGTGYSIFPLYLAAKHACKVHVTDNEEYLQDVLRFHAAKIRKLGLEEGVQVIVEKQDARRLVYPDGAFDRVTCISVIEHIPDAGDSAAMAEIGRVLKHGGRALITVPYAQVYEERASSPWVEYFERSYDDKALKERLIGPSGLVEVARVFFGEKPNSVSRLYNRNVSSVVRTAVQMLTPLIAPQIMQIGPTPRSTSHGVMLALEKAE